MNMDDLTRTEIALLEVRKQGQIISNKFNDLINESQSYDYLVQEWDQTLCTIDERTRGNALRQIYVRGKLQNISNDYHAAILRYYKDAAIPGVER